MFWISRSPPFPKNRETKWAPAARNHKYDSQVFDAFHVNSPRLAPAGKAGSSQVPNRDMAGDRDTLRLVALQCLWIIDRQHLAAIGNYHDSSTGSETFLGALDFDLTALGATLGICDQANKGLCVIA
jgi:hypothetical protein